MVRPLAHGARLVTILILEKVKPILQATVVHNAQSISFPDSTIS
jgi:hypothetical protein